MIYKSNLQVRAHSSPVTDVVDVLVRETHSDGSMSYGQSVIMQTMTPGLMIEPTLKLDRLAAQTLMDDLWRIGLRPADRAETSSELAATQRHLDDMRRIAFDKLDIKIEVKGMGDW